MENQIKKEDVSNFINVVLGDGKYHNIAITLDNGKYECYLEGKLIEKPKGYGTGGQLLVK